MTRPTMNGLHSHWTERASIWSEEAERIVAQWEAETEPGYRLPFTLAHDRDVAKLRAAWCELLAAMTRPRYLRP